MPKNDVKVKVVTEKIPSYAINYSAVDGANVSFEVAGSEVTTAKEGDVVTVSVEVLEEYLFKNLSVASSDGEVALTTVEEGATYTFVMPAESVTVTLEVELAKKDYAISSLISKSSLRIPCSFKSSIMSFTSSISMPRYTDISFIDLFSLSNKSKTTSFK